MNETGGVQGGGKREGGAPQTPQESTPVERRQSRRGRKANTAFEKNWQGRPRRVVLGPEQWACYHIKSRSTGGGRVFGDVEKEAFRRMMWRLAHFAGLEIQTYAVMANHFHILAKVPAHAAYVARFSGEGGEELLLEHMGEFYPEPYMAALRTELADLRERELLKEADDLIANYLRRFCNMRAFVKELKEQFSRWYNGHHGQRGGLWKERFKSVLVEDGDALRKVAAYIDQNPVRAGIVADPKDYRWSGYGEAMGGSAAARLGLCQVVGHAERGASSWDSPVTAEGRSAADEYRRWLTEDQRGSGAAATGD